MLFDELKAGLSAPLAGMGLSFSSSLFGIAGSLILGFLDLQVGQAQRRFRNEVESWLGTPHRRRSRALLRRHPLAHVGNPACGPASSSSGAAMADGASNNRAATQALSNLAEGIQGLVQHMRSEQQMIRDWVEAQAGAGKGPEAPDRSPYRRPDHRAMMPAAHRSVFERSGDRFA